MLRILFALLLVSYQRCAFAQELRTADFNSDGTIEFIDHYIFTVGAHDAINNSVPFEEGDLNGDGFFNIFDGFAFNAQWREGKGNVEPAPSPPGNELSLIVDPAGNMWAWGLLKSHPRERELLMGYSIRSKSGNLIPTKGRANLFASFHRRTEFEVIAADQVRFRVDGSRPLKTKVDPVDLSDLSFRYGSADGVFESLVHPGIPGDADLDGEVEFADFLLVSANFGTAGEWGAGDFDHDGMVAFADFLVLSTNFGQQLPGFTTLAVAVPESHGSALSLCLAAILLHVRGPRRRCVPSGRAKAV